jgi:hypothetical protein
MKLSRRGKSARRGRHTKRAGKKLRYRGKKVRGSKRYHLGHKRTHKRGRRLQRGGEPCDEIAKIEEWRIDINGPHIFQDSHVNSIPKVMLRNKKSFSFSPIVTGFNVVLRILRDKTLRIEFIRDNFSEKYIIRDLNMFNTPKSREWIGVQLGDETVEKGKCSFDYPQNKEIFNCIEQAIRERLARMEDPSPDVFKSFRDVYPK